MQQTVMLVNSALGTVPSAPHTLTYSIFTTKGDVNEILGPTFLMRKLRDRVVKHLSEVAAVAGYSLEFLAKISLPPHPPPRYPVAVRYGNESVNKHNSGGGLIDFSPSGYTQGGL